MLKKIRNGIRKAINLFRRKVIATNWVTYAENGKLIYDGSLEKCPPDVLLKMKKFEGELREERAKAEEIWKKAEEGG